MKIEKQRLSLIDKSLIFQLFNDPLVQRHMPLASEHFTEHDYQEFIKAKEQIWQEKGFGPEAYFVDGQFIGWAGIQPVAKD